MRKHAFLATAVAILAVGFSASAASATTIKSGGVNYAGAVTGTAGTTVLNDATTSVSITCTASSVSGSITTAGAVTITSQSFTGCTGLGATWNVTHPVTGWTGAATYVGPTAPEGTLAINVPTGGVKITGTGLYSLCNFQISGTETGKTTNSTSSALFTNATAPLVVDSASAGCLGVVANTHATSFAGTYALRTGGGATLSVNP